MLFAVSGCAPSLRLVSTTAEPLGDRRIPEAIAFVSAIETSGFEGQLIYEVRLLDARFRPVRSGNGRFQNQSGEVTARKTLMVSQSPWKFENEAVAIPVPELEINAGMLPLVAEFMVRPSERSTDLSARQLVMIPVNIYPEPQTGSPQLVWGEYPRTAETERLKAIASGKQPASEPRRRRREPRTETVAEPPPRDSAEMAAAEAARPAPPAEQPPPPVESPPQVADAAPPSAPPSVAPEPTEAQRSETARPARTTPRPRRAPYTRPPRSATVPGDVQPPPRFTGLPPYRERETAPDDADADASTSAGSPAETAPAPQDAASTAAPRPPVMQRDQQALLTPASRGGRRSFDDRTTAARSPDRRPQSARPPLANGGQPRDVEGPAGNDLETREYRVAKGDSLHLIARRELGDEARWEEVFLLNWDRLEAPDDLAEGMVLRLPVAGTAASAAAR